MLNITTKGCTMAVVVNDLQIPFQDEKAVNVILKFIKEKQPKIIVLNGDIIDCFEVSAFTKSVWVESSFKKEISQTKAFLSELRLTCPDSRIIFIEGNHEFRIKKYLNNYAREIAFLDILNLEYLLDLSLYNIEYIQVKKGLNSFADNFIKIDELYIGHFNRVNKHSGYTAKNLADDKGVCLIQGHTHRGGTYYKTLINGTIIRAFENFCLCDQSPNYLVNPNWQLGFTIVLFNEQHYVYPIELINYSFFWGDKYYR